MRDIRRWAEFSLVVAGVAASPMVARAADMPLYKFEPGQAITYDMTSTMHTEGSGEVDGVDGKSRIFIVGKVAGGWKFVAIVTSSFWQGTRPAGTRPAAQEGAQERSSLIVGVVHPDGTTIDLSENPAFGSLDTFLPVPKTERAAIEGYTAPANDGATWQAKAVERGEKEWVFDAQRKSTEDDIYLATNNAKVRFDLSQGLPVRWDLTFTQGYGIKGKGESVIELKGVEMKDAAWVAQLARDADVYQEATKRNTAALENLKGDEAAMREQLKGAAANLKAAAGKIQTPEIQQEFKTTLAQDEGYADDAIEFAKRKAAVLGKPAPEWDLPRVGGGQVSLKSLRGKIVVLDFWYRGCGWCIKAMPQINELSEAYKDKGVVVLGMNTDADEKDARFVMEKLKLAYGSLRSPRDLPGKYGVQGFPTLIVIDQAGIIQKVDEGYSPTLRKDLGEALDGLLKK